MLQNSVPNAKTLPDYCRIWRLNKWNFIPIPDNIQYKIACPELKPRFCVSPLAPNNLLCLLRHSCSFPVFSLVQKFIFSVFSPDKLLLILAKYPVQFFFQSRSIKSSSIPKILLILEFSPVYSNLRNGLYTYLSTSQ